MVTIICTKPLGIGILKHRELWTAVPFGVKRCYINIPQMAQFSNLKYPYQMVNVHSRRSEGNHCRP